MVNVNHVGKNIIHGSYGIHVFPKSSTIWLSYMSVTKNHIFVVEFHGEIFPINTSIFFSRCTSVPRPKSPSRAMARFKSWGLGTSGCGNVWKLRNSRWLLKVHPGRLTAGTYSHHPFRKENDLNQTSMIMFHVNLPGCKVCLFFFAWGQGWSARQTKTSCATTQQHNVFEFPQATRVRCENTGVLQET